MTSLSIINRLRNWRFRLAARVDSWFVQHMPASKITATLYYGIINSSFSREQVAVFAGKRRHLAVCSNLSSQRYLLRRNTHRLEKGLLMRPRRRVFAQDYIRETVGAYELVMKADGQERARLAELSWYSDVLHAYFAAIDLDHHLTALKERYLASSKMLAKPKSAMASAPYKRQDLPALALRYEELLLLFRRRRSTRWFQQRPVERNLIDKSIVAALQAPSACNRQPFEFKIVDDPDAVKRIAAIPMGTRGYADNIPVLITIVGCLDAYFDERDRHVIYIDGALAAMNMMLALESLGLSSCPINWPDITEPERKLAKLLALQPWQRPLMLLAVGYPDPSGGIAYSEKSPLEVVREYVSV